jgi:hypothetical protein
LYECSNTCTITGVCEATRDELKDGFARLERLLAELHDAVAAYDEAGLWQLDGASSMTAWLRAETGLTQQDAGRFVTTGARLRKLPATAQAWRDGVLSSGQVQAIVVNVPPGLVEDFAASEAELLPVLTPLPVQDVARAMRWWRAHHDGPEPDDLPTELHLSETMKGRYELTGHLDADGGKLVATALEIADTHDFQKKPSERQADALVAVCTWYLDRHDAAPKRRHRPHVSVVVDVKDLDDPTTRAWLCDSRVNRILRDGSIRLDYGRTTRVISPKLAEAVAFLDGHCRFPGCDRRTDWCDVHHVWHWIDGGPTVITNLVSLCRHHHTTIHKPGWSARRLPDATFEVTTPDGRTLRSHPPPRDLRLALTA